MAGNPASIAASIACLEVLQGEGVYKEMDRLATKLTEGLQTSAYRHGVPLAINRIRGSLSIHFCDHPVTNYEEAQDTDGEAYAAFFRHMLDRNVNLAPSKYEAWFLTTAHTEQDIDDTLEAAEASFREMGKK